MPRRGFVPKREVLPDPVYGTVIVSKLINQIMYDGKRGTAQSVCYDAFEQVAEKTGKDYYAAGYRDQNSTNPPLLSWAEWECYQIHGDVTRFSKVINGKTIYERLCDHYEFINKNKLEKKFGLYGKTGGLGTGLDDSPNQGVGQIYNSLTMQQAQNAYYIALIAQAMGNEDGYKKYMAEHDRIAAAANELMWDEERGMFCDYNFVRKEKSDFSLSHNNDPHL